MSNATRWYTTREQFKRAVGVDGTQHNSLLDGYIEAASEEVERLISFQVRKHNGELKAA